MIDNLLIDFMDTTENKSQETEMADDTVEVKPVTKKKTKKKAAQKRVAKKAKRGPGRPKGSTNVKRPGHQAGKKKAKRRGRPAGRKAGKRRGRPAAGRGGKSTKSIAIPVANDNLQFWNDMVVFLNAHKGKAFIVQMDGSNFSLLAD